VVGGYVPTGALGPLVRDDTLYLRHRARNGVKLRELLLPPVIAPSTDKGGGFRWALPTPSVPSLRPTRLPLPNFFHTSIFFPYSRPLPRHPGAPGRLEIPRDSSIPAGSTAPACRWSTSPRDRPRSGPCRRLQRARPSTTKAAPGRRKLEDSRHDGSARPAAERGLRIRGQCWSRPFRAFCLCPPRP